MPNANLIRLSIKGAMPNGELWSVNPVWQIGGVSTTEDVTPADVVAIATAVNAVSVPAGLLALLSTSCNINGCRVEARTWDGTLAVQAEGERTPVPGTSASAALPFQSSLVFSLRTVSVGGSGRGRLYWPATGTVLSGTTLRPNSTVISNAVSGMKTYLTSLTAAIAPSLVNAPVLSVWSRTQAGTHPVTSLQAGDVLDVQRRRRDSLIETYTSLSFP